MRAALFYAPPALFGQQVETIVEQKVPDIVDGLELKAESVVRNTIVNTQRNIQNSFRDRALSFKDVVASEAAYGTTVDLSEQWAAALDYCVRNGKALYLPDDRYLIRNKAVIDGANTDFKNIRIFGDARSTGNLENYMAGKAGPTIYTDGNGAIEVWFRRFYNENISIEGVNFVDFAVAGDNSTATTVIGTSAVELDPATPVYKKNVFKPGMVVSGVNIPKGAKVISVAGNTLNLSLPSVASGTISICARCPESAIKIKKGDPSLPDLRYISNLNFTDISVSGYVDPLVIQGMYKNGDADGNASYLYNFVGPVNIERYYPYSCGSGLMIANASLNRLHVSDSLWFQLSDGGLITVPDGDVGVGNGMGSVVMAHFDMFHTEGVAGAFRLHGNPPMKNTLHLSNCTREFNGIYGPVGPGGFFAGDPFGILGPVDLIISGRVDSELGYGEDSLPYLPPGSTVSTQSPIKLNMGGNTGGSKVYTPELVNNIEFTYPVADQGTLLKSVMLAEGADKTFTTEAEILLDNGALGTKKIFASGKTNTANRFAEMSGQIAAGITISTGYQTSTDMFYVSVNNTTGNEVSVTLRVKSLDGWQMYLL